MRIILAIVEETIDTAIDGCRQFLWNDVPLVVAFDIEKAALIIRISLRLIKMAVLSDVFFHITMGIQAVVALQLRGEAGCGI